jgi:nucleoprotein TPR
VKAEEEKWSGEVAALKTQLQELQQQQAVVVVPSIVDNSSTAAIASMHASNYERAIQNYDMLGMTEMYDRIVQMDRELFAERSKRKEVEMYLQQILKDVESKAPILASQRRDYYRIIESHASLANRLDLLVQENSDLKHAVDNLRRDSSEAREESQALSIHNSDLCQQVQHLLRMSLDIGRRSAHSNDGVAIGSRRAVVEATDDEEEEGGINPQDVISEYLVTFDDVVDLQRKNAELLRVVRKLSKEPALMLLGDGEGESTTASSANATSASAQKESSSNSRALQAAMEELSEMREARQRMEEMVVVLVQQRDMYRSMVEGEPNLFPQSNLLRSPGSDMQAGGSYSLNSTSSGTLGAISLRELQAKLAQAEEEKKR